MTFLASATNEAATLFGGFIDKEMPAGACPGEHPMYSYRRIGRLSCALQCLKVFAPGRDVSSQENRLKRAEGCANANHAVG